MAVLHLTTWVQTLLLCWLYRNTLRLRNRNNLFAITALFFLLIAFVDSFYLRTIWTGPNSYTDVVRCIIVILLSLLYFEQLLRELRNIQLSLDPMFLISTGVILYYAGTITIFLLEPDMIRHQQITQIWIMYMIDSLLLIVFNGLIALALHYASQSVKSRGFNPMEIRS